MGEIEFTTYHFVENKLINDTDINVAPVKSSMCSITPNISTDDQFSIYDWKFNCYFLNSYMKYANEKVILNRIEFNFLK